MSDEKVSILVEIKNKPSESLVALLTNLLKEAEKGYLLGAVVFCNYADEIGSYNAGHVPFSSTIACLEEWKFMALVDRNLKKINE